jgi:hypothetical protein
LIFAFHPQRAADFVSPVVAVNQKNPLYCIANIRCAAGFSRFFAIYGKVLDFLPVEMIC